MNKGFHNPRFTLLGPNRTEVSKDVLLNYNVLSSLAATRCVLIFTHSIPKLDKRARLLQAVGIMNTLARALLKASRTSGDVDDVVPNEMLFITCATSTSSMPARALMRTFEKTAWAMLVPRTGPRLLQKLTRLVPMTTSSGGSTACTALYGIWLQIPMPNPTRNW